jgi:ATP-binding protein involved in chromosome partitioning
MTVEQVTESDVLSALAQVTDPEIGRTLSELDMIKGVECSSDGSIQVRIELITPAYPNRNRITEAVQSAITAACPNAGPATVEYSFEVRGKNSGGTIGLKVKNVIAVGSGKGGVGKSTIAASLAFGLKNCGAKVGLMDADVYGPSIPHMLGITGQPAAVEYENEKGEKFTRIEPLDSDGVKVMSMGFFVEPEKAVVWRGPLLHRAISQFLKDTDWGELDYLIIDMPPGTGDISLTLSQMIGLAGAVIVCTPQKVALLDAVKAISMFGQVNIPVLGVVENMTGEIFGRGGAQAMGKEMGFPFLGEVPIDATIRINGDSGRIADLFADDCPAREHLIGMCEQVAIETAKQILKEPAPPTLEIL